MVELEEALGFSQHHVSHLDFYIRKFASDDRMNKNQYKLIGRKLALQLTNSPNTRGADLYYSNLLFYQGEYSRTFLLILAIMLGTGSSADRLRLLFEVYDTELTNKMTVSDMNELVQTMRLISLEQVELLVSYELLEKKPAAELKEYLRRIMLVADHVEKEIKRLLFRGDKHRKFDAVLQAISDPQVARLLTTTGIRTLAIEIYKEKTGTQDSDSKP